MDVRKLLSYLGKQSDELIPAASRNVDEFAEELGPEVIGKGTSKLGKEAAEEIPEAMYKEITPTTGMDDMSFLNRMDPRLKKYALPTAAVGAGAAALMMGGDEEVPQVPFRPKDQMPPESVLPDNYNALAQEEALNQSVVSSRQNARPNLGHQIEAQPSRSSAEEEMNYLNMMKEAQAKKGDADIGSLFAQAGADIAAGFGAGSGLKDKPDYSAADWLAKRGEKGISDVKGLMETDASEKKMKQVQREMNDEQSLRDSGSDISKTARDIAKSLGINVTDKTSAKQLQDAGLPLGTLLSTKMAADSRREMAALAGMSKKEQKDESNKLKVQSSVDKQVSQLLKSKDYEAYNAAKDAQVALTQALESGDKTASGSAFMQFAKIAQGDNSVVRDGDMAILAGGYNYTSASEMLSKLAAKARGGNFNAKELEQMKVVAAKAQEIKGRRVQQLMSPIVKRAGAAELNLAESLDPAMVSEFSGGQSEQAPLTTQSRTVTIRRKSDGVTKVMDLAKAKKMDPAKYEILQ